MTVVVEKHQIDTSEVARRLIEAALEPDIEQIVAEGLGELSEAERDALAEVGLHYALRTQMGRLRRGRVSNLSPGWAAVAAAEANGSLATARTSVFDWPEYVDGEWKLLGDCTLEDLELIAAAYDDRATSNRTQARRFWDLAGYVSKEQAQTVRGLDEGVVASVMEAE